MNVERIAQAVSQHLHGFGARRAELLAHQLIGGQRRFLIRLVEYSVHGCGEFFSL